GRRTGLQCHARFAGQRRQRRDHLLGGRWRPHAGAHAAARRWPRRHRPATDRIPGNPMMKTFRMNHALLSATAALLLSAGAPALAVEPFTADYNASYMGLKGSGRMTLEPQGDDRWKYTLSIGSGAIKLDQSTVFEDRDGQWRPLSGTDSSLLLIKKTDKQ